MSTSRYADHPDHPLRDTPQEVLDSARDYLRECVWDGDLYNPDSEMIESIADAIILEIIKAGYKISK